MSRQITWGEFKQKMDKTCADDAPLPQQLLNYELTDGRRVVYRKLVFWENLGEALTPCIPPENLLFLPEPPVAVFNRRNETIYGTGDGSWPVMEHFGKSQIEEILPLQDSLNGNDSWPVVWITREEAEKVFPRKPPVERITDTYTCTRHLNPVEDIPVGTVCPVCQFGQERG